MDFPITRLEDWPARLLKLVAERETWPFVWGVHDCCLFAAEAVHAMTGIDCGRKFRGQYSDAAGAARVLAEYGGTPAGVVASFGFQEVAPGYAQRGDLVLARWREKDKPRRYLLVCLGQVAVGPGPEKLTRVPREAWEKAWRI